ncbi:MAG TPA: hypothetical protein VG891_02770 [Rhizomicrobium sp.]|jgi:hypothetical protein|nr:hypothetical protein [Rhizomicrobium sp.]
MSAAEIAKKHVAAALAEGEKEGCDSNAIGRYMLSEIISNYLRNRSVKDVQSELMFLAENCDPDTDYMFMRP